MKFICSSMKQAASAGKMPTARKVKEAILGYFEYGQGVSVNRGFMFAKGGDNA
jgi:hypothetical protein